MPRWGWYTRFDPEGAFWSKVDRTGGPNVCWCWLAAEDSNGYGAVRWNGKKVNAHRVALELKLGRAILDGLFACHTCNRRICCNPSHLYEGTREQNVQDAVRSGTHHKIPDHQKPHGERVATAQLTESQVLAIYRRAWNGESGDRLATEFGIHKATVYRIKNGEIWGWLTERQ